MKVKCTTAFYSADLHRKVDDGETLELTPAQCRDIKAVGADKYFSNPHDFDDYARKNGDGKEQTPSNKGNEETNK